MATNFGKRLHRLCAPKADDRERAMELLERLSEKPHHRWIPFQQIVDTEHATITDRQAHWLWLAFKRYRIDAAFEPAGPIQ